MAVQYNLFVQFEIMNVTKLQNMTIKSHYTIPSAELLCCRRAHTNNSNHTLKQHRPQGRAQ